MSAAALAAAWPTALRRQGVTDVDDSDARQVPLRQRRRALPDPAAGRGPAAHADEIAATLAVARETGTPITMRGAGTSIAGNAVGAGHRHRHQPAPQPGARARPRGADRARPAGRGARRPPAARDPGRPAVRPRPVDPHPLHDRRDDRQQRLRLAGPGLRPHGRQRRGARRVLAGRSVDGGFDRLDRRCRCTPARLPLVDEHLGTVRTEFGRFGRQVSGYSFEHLLPGERPPPRPVPGRHRGHARAWCSTRRSASSRTRPPGRWRCSATRRWPTPRTPYPPCWTHPLVACEGLDQRIAGHGPRPPGAARRAAAGSSPRSPVPTRPRPSRRAPCGGGARPASRTGS